MSLSHEPELDDQQLTRYLLGMLAEQDAERLDELSIADDDVAWRLRAVETDLVDAYVGGMLSGEWLERFESFYLSSPRRREKVQFAKGFLGSVDRAAAPPDTGAGRREVTPARDVRPAARIVPWSKPAWRLAAAAAALVLLASGTLLFRDRPPRNGDSEPQAASARQSGPATTPAPAATPQPLLAALVLTPQTRAVGPIATLAVPRGADRVAFDLRLDTDDFPRYQVALKDPATNTIIWRSTRIAATKAGGAPTVSVAVPTSVLKAQHYSLELSGRTAAGTAEVVGSYAVRIEIP